MDACALLKIPIFLKTAFSAEITVIDAEMAVHTDQGITVRTPFHIVIKAQSAV